MSSPVSARQPLNSSTHTHIHTHTNLPSLPLSSPLHSSLSPIACSRSPVYYFCYLHFLTSLSCHDTLHTISVSLLCKYPQCWSLVRISACIAVMVFYLPHRPVGFPGYQYELAAVETTIESVLLWTVQTEFQNVIMPILLCDGNIYCRKSSDPELSDQLRISI